MNKFRKFALTVCLLSTCFYASAQVAVLTKTIRNNDPVKVNPNGAIDPSEFEGLGIVEDDNKLQGPMTGLEIILDLDNLSLSYVFPHSDDDSIEVKVHSAENRVVIPSTITPPSLRLYTVTEIAEEAFHDFKTLTSVTIPGSITSIGEHAFRGCPLDTITLCSLQPIVCSDNAFDESVYKNAVLNVPKKWKQRKAAGTASAWGKFRTVRRY